MAEDGSRGLGDEGAAAHVFFHELEDEVEVVVFADDFLELDDVGVPQLAKRLHLAQRHTLVPRVVLALHALDCHLDGRSCQCLLIGQV